MQKHIHQAQTAGVGDDLIAAKGVVFEEFLFLLIQAGIVTVRPEKGN
jgi:hypothetical protein